MQAVLSSITNRGNPDTKSDNNNALVLSAINKQDHTWYLFAHYLEEATCSLRNANYTQTHCGQMAQVFWSDRDNQVQLLLSHALFGEISMVSTQGADQGLR